MTDLGGISGESLTDSGLRITALDAAVTIVVGEGNYAEPGPAALDIAKGFYGFLTGGAAA